MLFRYLVFILLSAAGGVVSAQSFDINLNNDTAEFNLNAPLPSGLQLGGTEMNLGFLYTKDDDYMGMAGLQVMGSTGSGSPGLSAGLGVKVLAAIPTTTMILLRLPWVGWSAILPRRLSA